MCPLHADALGKLLDLAVAKQQLPLQVCALGLLASLAQRQRQQVPLQRQFLGRSRPRQLAFDLIEIDLFSAIQNQKPLNEILEFVEVTWPRTSCAAILASSSRMSCIVGLRPTSAIGGGSSAGACWRRAMSSGIPIMRLLLRSRTTDGRLKRRPFRHGRQMRVSEGVFEIEGERLAVLANSTSSADVYVVGESVVLHDAQDDSGLSLLAQSMKVPRGEVLGSAFSGVA